MQRRRKKPAAGSLPERREALKRLPQVGKLLEAASASVLSFERMELGEGIEKKSENFADEVMAQVKGG